jgi:hypothetical protein
VVVVVLVVVVGVVLGDVLGASVVSEFRLIDREPCVKYLKMYAMNS